MDSLRARSEAGEVSAAHRSDVSAVGAVSNDSRVVTVEIHGQQYPIRSGLDPAYVLELATYVDAKMRVAARETVAGETVKVAVLAALNIADECFRLKAEDLQRRDSLTARTEELERMLDLALGLGEPRAAAR